MRHIFTTLAVAAVALAACSTDTPAPPAPAPATPAEQPAPDPFLGYFGVVGKYGEITNDALGRQKFKLATDAFCPQGRQTFVQSKKASDHSTGPADVRACKNQQAADEMGALWQFGCDQGHDVGLYTPLPAETAAPAKKTTKKSAPKTMKSESESQSYTGGSKADPDYEQKKACSGAGGTNADCGIGNEARAYPDSNYYNYQYRDVNGETKAQYCARTGQSLSTCQAG